LRKPGPTTVTIATNSAPTASRQEISTRLVCLTLVLALAALAARIISVW
jgi:hypothetical protein